MVVTFLAHGGHPKEPISQYLGSRVEYFSSVFLVSSLTPS